MRYTPEVQELVDDPLGGRSASEVRRIAAGALASAALAHRPDAYMIEKFCADHDYAHEAALALFEETKRFLVVGELLDRKLAPSLPVDQMWHSWILFTKDYHRFCDGLGGYIHHRPIPAGSPEQPPIESTVAVMEAAFGPVRDECWPQEFGAYGGMDCKMGP